MFFGNVLCRKCRHSWWSEPFLWYKFSGTIFLDTIRKFGVSNRFVLDPFVFPNADVTLFVFPNADVTLFVERVLPERVFPERVLPERVLPERVLPERVL